MIGRKFLKRSGQIALGLVGIIATSCATTTSNDTAATLPPDDFWFEGDGMKEAVDAELAKIDGFSSNSTVATSSYRNSPPPRTTTSNAPLPSRPVTSSSTSSVSTPSKPKPAPTSSSSQKTVSHTVKKGDSLWSISRRYGSSVRAIAAANGLSSDTIGIGQVLKVPSGSGASSTRSSTPAAPAKAKSHTVAKGDTLWSLSQKYGTTVDSIKKKNSMSTDDLSIGQKLLIP